MVKKYAFERETGAKIGVVFYGGIYRDGFLLYSGTDNPDYEIREVTIPDEKLLECYSLNSDEDMYYGDVRQYEIREKGRYHAIVISSFGTPKLALLCKMGCDGETGHVFVFKNPFDSISDRPAAYLENDNDDDEDSCCDGTFLAWVIFDDWFYM